MKTIGRATIITGSAAAVVENPAIKENSEIFVTFRKQPRGEWWIDETHDGVFILKMAQPVPEDVSFSYWIVDVVNEMTLPATPLPETPDSPLPSEPSAEPPETPVVEDEQNPPAPEESVDEPEDDGDETPVQDEESTPEITP
jgi:hypothetical protein